MYLGNGGLNQGHSPLGLKNRVLAGRGGEVLTMENANLHPPPPPRIMNFTCTYSILVPACIAVSSVQKMNSEPLLHFAN